MEAEPIPSSPTISSLSSSDLDTESTGSFFPDRSTSLGTLMGVTFPDPPDRLPSRRTPTGDASRRSAPPPAPHHRRRRHRRRGSWWRLCRDETVHTSLGEFLQVERRLADASSTHGHFIYGGAAPEHEAVGGGPLFEDGRVLPPQDARGPRGRPSDAPQAGSTIRFPVLLAGICSGGEGYFLFEETIFLYDTEEMTPSLEIGVTHLKGQPGATKLPLCVEFGKGRTI